jgi:hypothetical protein
MEGEPRMKGLSFHSVLDAIERARGRAFREAVERSFREPLATPWSHREVVANGWYPIAWYREVWRAIRTLEPDPAFVRRIGRESVEVDLKTIHRVLLSFLSTTRVASLAGKLMERYFDRARIDVRSIDRTHLVVRWTGCDGFDDTMWIEMLATAERLIELSGVEGLRTTLLSGGRGGASEAELDVRW